jgi:hypothetical protein
MLASSGRASRAFMIEGDDPVLAFLPDDDDLPHSFRILSPDERSWRGRLMLMTWIVTGNESYAWSVAMADDEPHNTESRKLAASVPDQRLIEELRQRPLCTLPGDCRPQPRSSSHLGLEPLMSRGAEDRSRAL